MTKRDKTRRSRGNSASKGRDGTRVKVRRINIATRTSAVTVIVWNSFRSVVDMGRAGQEWTRRNTARSINHLHQPRLSLVMASGGGELVQARGRDPIDQSAGRASASRHEHKRGVEMPGRCSEAPGSSTEAYTRQARVRGAEA